MKEFDGIPVYETLREIVDPSHSCLVVWDVQNATVERIFNKDEFVKNIKDFTAGLRGKMPFIYSKIAVGLPKGFTSSWSYYWRMKMFNVHNPDDMFKFAFSSGGMEILEDIKPFAGDIVIDKYTASLFVGTYFEQLLRNKGITTVIFTGIATEIGIESSARDASNRGFYPVVVSDCVSSMNKENHDRSIENMKRMYFICENSHAITEAVG
jgi:nicotinamidase-related amidase